MASFTENSNPEKLNRDEVIINIKELDVHSVNPRVGSKEETSSRIVVIGKPGSGKSTLIKNICYMKKHLIPAACVVSGTEDTTSFYAEMFPEIIIHESLSEDIVNQVIQRQKIAKEYLSNPWAFFITDDCMEDPSFFRRPVFTGMYKNGRHLKLVHILGLQWAMDILPSVRTCIDGTFIFREPILNHRKILYENYASIIPTFKMFCAIMDAVTSDNTALYINNRSLSNNFEDCIFWYKAEEIKQKFKVGCDDMWLFNSERLDPEVSKAG